MPTLKTIDLKVLDGTLEISDPINAGEEVVITVDFTGCGVDAWAKWLDVRLYNGTGAPISLGTDVICTYTLPREMMLRGRIEFQPHAILGAETVKYDVKALTVNRSLQVVDDTVNYDPTVLGTLETAISDIQVELDTLDATKSPVGHTHDDRYYTETETDTLLSEKSNTTHLHDDRYYTETETNSLLAGKSDTSHTHDSRYYTETETDALLSGKSDTSHTHDDRYFTETEVNTLLGEKVDKVAGKSLISDTEITRLLGIETGAEVNNISDVNATDLTDGGETTLHIHDGRYYTETETNTLLGNKADKLYATNLVTNGDFSNGTTGWSALNAGISVASNVLTMLATTQNGRVSQTVTTVSGRKYYFRTTFKANSNLVYFVHFNPTVTYYHTGSGNFESYSGVFTSVGTDTVFRIVDSRASGWANVELKYGILIDLTAIFGSGKEPSKEQMDNMLSTFTNSWFNGTAELVNIANLAQLKADKLFATNLVTNGDFSNGTTGWSAVNSTNSVVSGELVNSCTLGQTVYYASTSVSFLASRKYYVAIKVKTNSTLLPQFELRGFPGVFDFKTQTGAVQNTYYNLSGILTMPSSSLPNELQLVTRNVSASVQTTTTIDNAIVLDLTATFGAGNEPTATEMDTLLAKFPNSWFDGTNYLADLSEITKLSQTDLMVSGRELLVGTLTSNNLRLRTNNLNRMTINADGTIATSSLIHNAVSSLNAQLQLTETGTLIQRNVADANTALKVNQANASSTGNILSLQFGGVDKATFDKDGKLTNNSISTQAMSNGGYYYTPYGVANNNGLARSYVNTSINGTIISRDYADANTALTVNQVHASSTGKILDAQFGGVSKASIAYDGTIKGSYLSLATFANGAIYLNTNILTAQRNIADSNPAFIINQQNASSTGKILDLQFGGASKLSADKDGLFYCERVRLASIANKTNALYSIVYTDDTGVRAYRNVGDANTCLTVNQAHASSTGNIAEFQFNGTTKLAIDKDGIISSGLKSAHNHEGGFMIRLTNKTGVASVKGTLVSASTTTDNAFQLQSNEFDTIGVVYESGIADGAECWVVVSGVAQVLLKDGTASTRGYWAIASDADGRADITQPSPLPNNTLNEHTTHFKEIGHCVESKTAGTSVLAKVVLHFN